MTAAQITEPFFGTAGKVAGLAIVNFLIAGVNYYRFDQYGTGQEHRCLNVGKVI